MVIQHQLENDACILYHACVILSKAGDGMVKKSAAASETVNAVIYARYSSHNQTEQSIEGQLHDAYQYAEREGISVIGEYIDRALTGTRDQRPDFQRMIRDAEKHQFQLVIVWKLDRFARNRYDSATYKAKLKKHGVRVVSVMENITDSPEGIILEGLLESMAEYYSANLSENIRRGQRESMAKGWYLGSPPPLGYKVENHRLVADERTAPIAQEIFRRYADGESPKDIAADLNGRGLRTRRGHEFRISTFDGMLVTTTYIGKHVYSGQVIEGLADPIIDEEIFNRAVQRRQQNRRAPAARRAPVRYLLQGKIYCGMCGNHMIGESGKSRSGDIHRYYSCAERKNHHACKKKNEKKDFIEWYVCEQTLYYVLAPDRIDAVAAAVVDQYNKEFRGTQVEDLEKVVRRLDADLNKLVDNLLVMPEAARPKIAERMEALGAQKAEAEKELAKMRLARDIQLTTEQVKAWLNRFSSGDLMDEDFRQRIIDTFINSVYLYDDRIIVFYNIRGGKEVCYIDMIDALDEMDEVEGGSSMSVNAPPKTLSVMLRAFLYMCAGCEEKEHAHLFASVTITPIIGPAANW